MSARMKFYFLAIEPKNWLAMPELSRRLSLRGWNTSEQLANELKPIELSAEDLEVDVSESSQWWASLALNVEVDGKLISLLPILLSALKTLPRTAKLEISSVDSLNKDGRFVTVLPDGKVISFPFDRIRNILVVLQELSAPNPSATKVKTSLAQIDSLLNHDALSEVRWRNADKTLSVIERLRKMQQVPAVLPPVNFNATLRPYQLEGLSWLQQLTKQDFGGILADDMGLGKTIQLLAHVCLEKEAKRLRQPYLIVCPTSVVPNWLSECAKFAPKLRVVNLSGADRFERFKMLSKADLAVTSYALVSRDFLELEKISWSGIVLDEAQAIKNSESLSAMMLCQFKTGHRICLTGTPIQNNLGELWSQFRFLNPGLLGDQSLFTKTLRVPIEKLGDQERRRILNSRIRPFILRRTKSRGRR